MSCRSCVSNDDIIITGVSSLHLGSRLLRYRCMSSSCPGRRHYVLYIGHLSIIDVTVGLKLLVVVSGLFVVASAPFVRLALCS